MDLERQLAAYDRYLEAEDTTISAWEIIAENIQLKDELRMLGRQDGGSRPRDSELRIIIIFFMTKFVCTV
jgi:hypothetical protein